MPKNESVLSILVYFLNNSTDFREVVSNNLKCSQLISSSDNKKSKKTLLTTRNVRLNSDRFATKYYRLV
jgi:hypothetical protein